MASSISLIVFITMLRSLAHAKAFAHGWFYKYSGSNNHNRLLNLDISPDNAALEFCMQKAIHGAILIAQLGTSFGSLPAQKHL